MGLVACFGGVSAPACSAIPSSNGAEIAVWDAAATWDGALSSGGSANLTSVDASACQPGDVQTFVPDPYHPASGAHQSVCSPGAIALIYAHCFDPATRSATACSNDFSIYYVACAACIVTPLSAAKYGPLVTDSSGWVRPNVAGCIELLDPNGAAALSCAKNVQALSGCELEACEANCPVNPASSASLAPYQNCAAQADLGGCAPFVAAARCELPDAGGPDAGAALTICSQSSLEAYYESVVPLFCGAAPESSSGGYDASSPSEDAGAGADASSAEPTDAPAD